jgi:hypothetical protein
MVDSEAILEVEEEEEEEEEEVVVVEEAMTTTTMKMMTTTRTPSNPSIALVHHDHSRVEEGVTEEDSRCHPDPDRSPELLLSPAPRTIVDEVEADLPIGTVPLLHEAERDRKSRLRARTQGRLLMMSS